MNKCVARKLNEIFYNKIFHCAGFQTFFRVLSFFYCDKLDKTYCAYLIFTQFELLIVFVNRLQHKIFHHPDFLANYQSESHILQYTQLSQYDDIRIEHLTPFWLSLLIFFTKDAFQLLIEINPLSKVFNKSSKHHIKEGRKDLHTNLKLSLADMALQLRYSVLFLKHLISHRHHERECYLIRPGDGDQVGPPIIHHLSRPGADISQARHKWSMEKFALLRRFRHKLHAKRDVEDFLGVRSFVGTLGWDYWRVVPECL